MIDNKLIDFSYSDHIQTLDFVKSDNFSVLFKQSIDLIYSKIIKGKNIFSCGNGGSFSDSQHFIAELVVRYKRERKPFSAYALGANQSVVTASGNDYCYEDIFLREFKALSRKDDLVVGISTSGTSRNILKVIEYASENSIDWILLTSDLNTIQHSDGIIIDFPWTTTASIQESHIFFLHLLCRALDELVLGNDN
ncbi:MULTISPECIES: SIS domain-containing protein [unclassified Prochlorococcus]|uniref:D-sedoheptulose-7-phosphate isomerase n=1 Tax=unclassified Prochlorococcus TaxID=2627481 RepID=UPI00053371C0|nr:MULTISPECIES: SIS domain-containing protein [unclassified Prochlorococcus]KGG16331.1 Phosphoheptose isomerase 1 [Prochlorococcus sp. MIT 0603]KGG17935.1 Phosphoheptose isomerase 1 [Prochlorococcus sp. MIT 0602]